MLELGIKAPDFELPDQNGEVHKLSDYAGKKLSLIHIQMCIRDRFTVTQPKFIPDCLRQWNFGLYVSGFWHIHAKTPRGIVVCEQYRKMLNDHNSFRE